MTQERLIEKLRKLFELSKSSNEHEAELAAEKAAEIMANNQITEAMLQVDEDLPANVADIIIGVEKRASSWKGTLIGHIAKVNNGKFYYSHLGSSKAYRVVGTESCVTTVRYLFGLISNQIEGIVRAENRRQKASGFAQGRAFYNAFRLGIVSRVGQRLEVTTARVIQRASTNPAQCHALMVIDKEKAAVVRFVAENLKFTTRRHSYSSGTGFHAGRAAGNDVHLGGGAKAGIGPGQRRIR